MKQKNDFLTNTTYQPKVNVILQQKYFRNTRNVKKLNASKKHYQTSPDAG